MASWMHIKCCSWSLYYDWSVVSYSSLFPNKINGFYKRFNHIYEENVVRNQTNTHSNQQRVSFVLISKIESLLSWIDYFAAFKTSTAQLPYICCPYVFFYTLSIERKNCVNWTLLDSIHSIVWVWSVRFFLHCNILRVEKPKSERNKLPNSVNTTRSNWRSKQSERA